MKKWKIAVGLGCGVGTLSTLALVTYASHPFVSPQMVKLWDVVALLATPGLVAGAIATGTVRSAGHGPLGIVVAIAMLVNSALYFAIALFLGFVFSRLYRKSDAPSRTNPIE